MRTTTMQELVLLDDLDAVCGLQITGGVRGDLSQHQGRGERG